MVTLSSTLSYDLEPGSVLHKNIEVNGNLGKGD